ncbi:MAG TPA: zinc ribbon domain-containing protein [Gammaproteobacteria bacterium]|uniref:Putative regulatory protein FmdB zinc ribbon domain-containing protein n=1 Tax=hydrothermal vent metagenome TaxID=652676 RepID=A0A3B0Z320_9ZZZZ|nr:zinc ribbon domain-containing protein [Gammaproteobacteria bacterium]
MPIYEYQCTECGLEMEKLQKLSDDPLTDCPECGKPTLQKKVSAAGFRLKGSGWYETDFKSKNRKNVAKGDNKPKSGGDSSGKSSSSKSSTGSVK